MKKTIKKQIAEAPKYILKLNAAELYLSNEQNLTGLNLSNDKNDAMFYAVGFDNIETKLGIWNAEAARKFNNSNVKFEIVYL